MTHKIVQFLDDQGDPVDAYRVEVSCGVILLVPVHRIESGETTIEAEVQALKDSLHA